MVIELLTKSLLFRLKSRILFATISLLVEVFLRGIELVSDGYYSVQFTSNRSFFGCVLPRVTLGSGRLVTIQLKIGYLSYRVSIISVSVGVRVE